MHPFSPSNTNSEIPENSSRSQVEVTQNTSVNIRRTIARFKHFFAVDRNVSIVNFGHFENSEKSRSSDRKSIVIGTLQQAPFIRCSSRLGTFAGLAQIWKV